MKNIYSKIASILTSFFVRKKVIPESNKEMYAYGFEVLLSSFVYTLLFIIVSVLTKTVIHSFCFFIGFYMIRSVSGGFHANTYTTCHILYLANHILFIIIIKVIPINITNIVASGLFIVSAILMLLFAPVDHPNKPFIKNEEARFRKLSIICSLLLIPMSVFVLLIINTLLLKMLLCTSIGSISATISLTIAKILKKRRI